jgi:hypothetical protein
VYRQCTENQSLCLLFSVVCGTHIWFFSSSVAFAILGKINSSFNFGISDGSHSSEKSYKTPHFVDWIVDQELNRQTVGERSHASGSNLPTVNLSEEESVLLGFHNEMVSAMSLAFLLQSTTREVHQRS